MEENTELQSIDLMEVLRVIRKRWMIVVALPLLALITSGVLSYYVIKPVYQASATVIVGKRIDDQSDKSVDMGYLTASQRLAKTYESIAKSRTVLDRVAAAMGENLTAGSLSGKVSVAAVKDTELIAITVQDLNPERAAQIANTITTEFSARVIEIKKVDSVSVIDAAQVPKGPIKPNKTQIMALSFVLGLFAAIGMVFLLEVLDNTVKVPDEVEKLVGLPVLGTIPRFDN